MTTDGKSAIFTVLEQLIWRYTLKNLLVICLALVLLASMGCGNKTENDENSTTTQVDAAKKVPPTDRGYPPDPVDPVDGSKIENLADAKYSYAYKGWNFYFNSKENYEAFKKDPEKYMLRIPKN